jgi:hypothetical protein
MIIDANELKQHVGYITTSLMEKKKVGKREPEQVPFWAASGASAFGQGLSRSER